MRQSLALVLALSSCADTSVLVPDPGTTTTTSLTSTSTTGTPGTSDATTGEPTTTAAQPERPRLKWWTPATTPGSTLYIETAGPISAVELRLAGVRLPEPLVLGTALGQTFGALFAVPDDIDLGAASLTIRERGAADDSDIAELDIQPPIFVDIAAAIGLSNDHDVAGHPKQCAESQTGLAFADIDGDGDSDAYIGNVGAPGRMLRNDGPASGPPNFVDITAELGLTVDNVASASFMDYDGDGDRDLFIGRRGPNVLLKNLGSEQNSLGFTDVTASAGVAGGDQRTMGSAWGDYDGDGDLDLYVVNHALCFPVVGKLINPQDHLYRNDGGDTFVEVTEQLLGVGPDSPVMSIGFSAAWLDVERDGDVDLVVINDHIKGLSGPNALWRNDGPDGADGWKFVSVGEASGLAIPAEPSGEGVNGMGLAIGDINYDGYPDIAFSNIGPNYLMFNKGDGTFDNVSETMRMRRGMLPWRIPSVTWAVHLFDYDNDADLDLYFAGGPIRGADPIPDALLRNDGALFTEVTWAGGLADFGHGKGSALVDLDRDGSLDLVTAHWARPLRVFENRWSAVGTAGHWLVIDLVGAGANRDAMGSIVAIDAPGLPRQTCFRSGNPSLSGGGELACHFGLGAATQIDGVTITWPNGQVSTPPPPAIDARITYTQP